MSVIKFTIAPGQPLKAEVINGQGNSCVELTKAIAQQGETLSVEYKREFYTQIQATSTVSVEQV